MAQNSFIMTAAGQTLLALFRRRIPDIVTAMRNAVRRDLASNAEPRATADLYAQLPTIDFSRVILPGQEANLRVLPVPQCGWSDLGTPQRVACALRDAPERKTDVDSGREPDYWSLAAQQERLQRAVGSGREASLVNASSEAALARAFGLRLLGRCPVDPRMHGLT